jgi:hypothetical protein
MGAYFAVSSIPLLLSVVCWWLWVKQEYSSSSRRRTVKAGLFCLIFAAFFLLSLPFASTIQIHGHENLKSAILDAWFVSGLVSAPLAALLVGFGHKWVRWLGIGTALFCLAADMVVIAAASA